MNGKVLYDKASGLEYVKPFGEINNIRIQRQLSFSINNLFLSRRTIMYICIIVIS